MSRRIGARNAKPEKLTHTDEKTTYPQPGASCKIPDVSRKKTGKHSRSGKNEKTEIREIISTVFKALTHAMGVAVVALSRLGSLDAQTAATLLGIGLVCAGAALLEKP